MSHWILIIILHGNLTANSFGETSTSTASFNTQSGCKAAADAANKEIREAIGVSGIAICVEDK